jgi:hypothetical protein
LQLVGVENRGPGAPPRRGALIKKCCDRGFPPAARAGPPRALDLAGNGNFPCTRSSVRPLHVCLMSLSALPRVGSVRWPPKVPPGLIHEFTPVPVPHHFPLFLANHEARYSIPSDTSLFPLRLAKPHILLFYLRLRQSPAQYRALPRRAGFSL